MVTALLMGSGCEYHSQAENNGALEEKIKALQDQIASKPSPETVPIPPSDPTPDEDPDVPQSVEPEGGGDVTPPTVVSVSPSEDGKSQSNKAMPASPLEFINPTEVKKEKAPKGPKEKKAPKDPSDQADPPSGGNADLEIKKSKVVGLKVLIQTGIVPNAGRDSNGDDPGQIMFDLCPTPNFNSGPCFRASFDDTGYLNLDAGDYETLDFNQHPEMILPKGKNLADLKYPDDFKFFRFASDPIKNVKDAWFLQGVEVKVLLEKENDYRTLYRNPCVGRWIEKQSGKNLYSPHSVEHDDAFCFYVATGKGDGAGTDDGVSIEIPMNKNKKDKDGNYMSLNGEAIAWIDSYQNAGETPLIKYQEGGSSFTVPLQFTEWPDFESGDGTSYAFTVYHGQHRMQGNYYKIQAGGDDAWELAQVKAYSFKPGDKDFLEKQSCRHESFSPNIWMSTDPNDDNQGPVQSTFPMNPNNPKDWDFWRIMEPETCPSLKDIEIEKDEYSYGKLG